ncbi:lipoyl(octanoyl) transferase LipB [Teredinibacter turnerae]|uniref:lipoyl(octanoyl) transferase LipB n=1 Tax=Teredinibacter turnerae TaxID=2426 RepID=UPI00036CF7CD|nr:lipoyl(octanoyl) transferase LipB [Teredinibacter turnerae]
MAAVVVKNLGQLEYETCWRAMREFTDTRDAATDDELWLVEHPPVYTQGQAGKPEHLLLPATDIPVVQTDRGGQITYHGPGQLVAYPLLNLKRRKLGVRDLVTLIENSVVRLLGDYGIIGEPRPDAPGVYVDGKKISSLGLRVRKGCSYHGVAINVNMDLQPFANINPCGYAGLAMVQLTDYTAEPPSVAEVADRYSARLLELLK